MRATTPLLACLAACASSGESHAPERPAHTVPTVAAPMIDGDVGEIEWRTSLRLDLGEGRALLATRDRRAVHLALVGFPDRFFGQIYLHSDGEVIVLHASARLGTLRYHRGDGGFVCDRTDWDFKSPERSLEEDGWTANVSPQSGEQEFKVLRELLPNDEVDVAVAWFSFRDGADAAIDAWPLATGDDCAGRELVAGEPPATAVFAPQRWTRLRWALGW